CARHGSFDFW
nr:immunoglobulin heavy chain junction region [Mus musculus]MBK4183896.1 immunoglobulin heavy chain junction region [Mus musculus]MBK4183897.1 immunoglobulin heavy chain junction region [Mus musculus]MBK4183898.1 immunoglobulin heavy chain junction region [Mus musculus]MBK4183899.1 immunoglobulin heavy chain junction region [Mus musculus]